MGRFFFLQFEMLERESVAEYLRWSFLSLSSAMDVESRFDHTHTHIYIYIFFILNILYDFNGLYDTYTPDSSKLHKETPWDTVMGFALGTFSFHFRKSETFQDLLTQVNCVNPR